MRTASGKGSSATSTPPAGSSTSRRSGRRSFRVDHRPRSTGSKSMRRGRAATTATPPRRAATLSPRRTRRSMRSRRGACRSRSPAPTIRPGSTGTVTATVQNTSPLTTVDSVVLNLELPEGVVASGSTETTLVDLPAGETRTTTWDVTVDAANLLGAVADVGVDARVITGDSEQTKSASATVLVGGPPGDPWLTHLDRDRQRLLDRRRPVRDPHYRCGLLQDDPSLCSSDSATMRSGTARRPRRTSTSSRARALARGLVQASSRVPISRRGHRRSCCSP